MHHESVSAPSRLDLGESAATCRRKHGQRADGREEKKREFQGLISYHASRSLKTISLSTTNKSFVSPTPTSRVTTPCYPILSNTPKASYLLLSPTSPTRNCWSPAPVLSCIVICWEPDDPPRMQPSPTLPAAGRLPTRRTMSDELAGR